MRTWIVPALLCASLLAGCEAVPSNSETVPVLFAVDGEYELVTASDQVVAYIFADTTSAGRQTLRWIVLEQYISPQSQQIGIRRVVQGGGQGSVPATAAEFADFARELMEQQEQATYAKSYADTFFTSYAPPGRMERMIVTVPIPTGRRPPDPPGVERPYGWPSMLGQYHEIDGGTVGIKKGPPQELPPGVHSTPVGGGGGGGGYLEPQPAGLIGMVVASPIEASDVEYWFLPGRLFQAGLDGTTLLPFANQAAAVTDAPAEQWVVVVVNTSYYPGFVPNDW